jgi:hypothetical protein
MTPNCSGVFTMIGEWVGAPFYRNGNWFLWVQLNPPGPVSWFISDTLGVSDLSWKHISPDNLPIGIYTPFSDTEGDCLVSEI